jgi:hypothetical protein
MMMRRLKKFLLYVSVPILGFILIEIILAGYSETATWTGFRDFMLPNGDFVRGKTLWDWMELLVIPLALAGGAFYLNRSERTIEREIVTDRQQEAALQSYLDRMADLLLKEKLSTSNSEEVRKVARIRTLTLLRGLDARRKGLVLQFLYEADLIRISNHVVDLRHAHL